MAIDNPVLDRTENQVRYWRLLTLIATLFGLTFLIALIVITTYKNHPEQTSRLFFRINLTDV